MADWTCPACGRRFRSRNARHSCTSQRPEAFLAPYPAMVPMYETVRDFLQSLGPVEPEATKTQIAFRARKRFAFLWIPAMVLKRGPPELFLTFDLAAPLRSSRVKQVVESHPGVWTHHVRLVPERVLDDELRTWLEKAYKIASRVARNKESKKPTRSATRAS